MLVSISAFVDVFKVAKEVRLLLFAKHIEGLPCPECMKLLDIRFW